MKQWLRALRREKARNAENGLLAGFPRVYAACAEIEAYTGLPPLRLACKYMKAVFAEENAETLPEELTPYLTEGWFIYEYGIKKEWFERREPEIRYYVLQPEGLKNYPYATLGVKRDAGGSTGAVEVFCAEADDALRALLKSSGFTWEKHCYTKQVSEINGPPEDRTAEIGARLLKAGCAIATCDPVVYRRIEAGDYAPEKQYWVLEGEREDEIEIRYPRDPVLHRYVYRAGGRWNGKKMLMKICDSEKLMDIIRMYDFSVTRGAKLRMEEWRRACARATIYKGAEAPRVAARDPFSDLLNRSGEILEDLRDD